MQAARWIFRLAGIVGIALAVPPFFIEGECGRENPPTFNQPEFYDV